MVASPPPLAVEASPTAGRKVGVFRELAGMGLEVWEYRELLSQLAKRDIKIRYKQAVMGLAWAVFMPVLIVLAGFVIRLALSSAGGPGMDRAAAGGLAVKGIWWSFFVGTIGFATTTLTANINLVTKIYFPREVLPLASMTAAGFDAAVAGAALVLAVPFLEARLTAALLWVPVLLLLLVILTAAAALFLSCANLFFRDVKYIVQVLLTFGILFTPVLFDAAMLGAHGAELVMLNPMAPILEGVRLAVFEGHNLLSPLALATAGGGEVWAWQPWYLAYAAGWAVLGLLGSAMLFHRAEFAFAEYA